MTLATLFLSAAEALLPQAATPPPVTAAPPAAQGELTADALGQIYYLYLKGRALDTRGDTPGALAAFREALALGPTADVHAEIAGVYAREGRATDALAAGNAALKLDPKHHEAHRIIGLVQSALAEQMLSGSPGPLRNEAIGHLEQALDGTRDPSAELTLGRLYLETNNAKKSIAMLTRFLVDRPDNPEAIVVLTEAYEQTGQVAEAARALEPLARDRPQLSRLHEHLGDLYFQLKKYREATAAFDRALAGDRAGVDVAALTKKRDRAKELGGGH